MRDHVQILVCGDEQVGKSSFIGTFIARHFPQKVPPVMTDVHIPSEENGNDVSCTISDCSALPRNHQQLVEKIETAESIVVLYDAQRPETLARLSSFWLPLIEGNTKGVPVVIVRNKVDTLVAEGGLGERSSAESRRQMAPLQERYKFFHTSLECSSVSQMGVKQVFQHALNAALYPIAPLYDAKAGQLQPGFERAMRRLFRIYDVDRDGLLGDDEINAFQYTSYQLHLSDEDISVLRRILGKVAVTGVQEQSSLVREASQGSPGGITAEGFVKLMKLSIEKKHMKAPWKALHSHHYDDDLVLAVPAEVSDPPPGKHYSSTGWHDQVLSSEAERVLLQLFSQFSTETAEASPGRGRVITEEGQAEVFSVIPGPTCAPWDIPRCRQDYDARTESELTGRLRRAPGASRALTVEGWMVHWQMLALHSPLLARAHLFYVGFKGRGEDMLVNKDRHQYHQRRAVTVSQRNRTVRQVYVLGSRGCGKTRMIKAMRLGNDLLSNPQEAVLVAASESGPEEGRGVAGGPGKEEDDWEMMVDAEVPEICAGFACLDVGDRENEEESVSSSLGKGEAAFCRSLAVTVTEIPQSFTNSFVEDQVWRSDLVLLVFDPSSRESLDFIKPLLVDIPEDIPRLVVSCESSRKTDAALVAEAQDLCEEQELSAVVVANPKTGQGFEGDDGLRQKIAKPCCPGMLPYAERNRKEKDRNRKIITAVSVVAVVAVVASCYVLSPTSSSPSSPSKNRKTFGGLEESGSGSAVAGALRNSLRAAKFVAIVTADCWKRFRSRGTGGGYDGAAALGSA